MRYIFMIGLLVSLWSGAVSAQVNSNPLDNPVCLEKLGDGSSYTKMKSYKMLVAGKEGWLFRDRTDFIENFTFGDQAIEGFQKLSEAFAEKGTELVIFFTPTRGVMGEEYLPELADFNPNVAKKNYQAMIKSMQDKGLHFVGLTDFSEKEDYFFKTDQHWTTKGARKSAQDIADYVQKMSPYKKLAKTDFETLPGETYTSRGRFNDVVSAICGQDLPEFEDRLDVTIAKLSGSPDLFGDVPDPDIVLMGTSNSKRESEDANISGALKEFLKADVQNEAMPGMGYDEPLLAFLNSDRYRRNPPKIMIWEIPGYYVVEDNSDFFNQAIAAVSGDCPDKKAVTFSSVKLEDTETLLVEGLAKQKIKNGQSYVALHFDRPVKKDFAVFFRYDDESRSTKRFKFKRSKRFPDDQDFYVVTPADKRDNIDQLLIQIPKNMTGMTVKGRFCNLPKNISGVGTEK